MTVETTIQRMFDEYPDLFSTRQECYDFLFCVIGNGYEWRRGQVVECDDEFGEDDEALDYATPHPRAEQTKENIAKRRKEDKDLRNLKRENDLAEGLPDIGPCNGFDEEGFPMKNSPWAVHHEECDSCRQICPLEVKMRWYPISEFSLIKRIPADIKPDWKEAVEECKEMLRKDGIEVN